MALKIVSKTPRTDFILNKAIEYYALRTQKKLIDERMKELSEELKNYAETKGVKDDKGSFYSTVGDYQIGKQCKKKVAFNEKAIPFFKKKKLTKAVKLVETIDEEAVEKYVSEGNISYEDLEQITSTKVEYAIDLKTLEELKEVEQRDYQAASKKPKSSTRK